MKKLKRKKRNPMAKELLLSGKYRIRIVKSKKLYSRKEKHKKALKINIQSLFLWHFHSNCLK